jgi:hypothetical protein
MNINPALGTLRADTRAHLSADSVDRVSTG